MKIPRRNMLIITAVFCLFGVSFLAQTGAAQDSSPVVGVKEGDYWIYGVESSATYRMYARNFRITVTNTSQYPIRGTLDLIHEEDNEWVVESSIENQLLVPYVVQIGNLKPGVENSPYYGYNLSRSYLVEKWDSDHLIIGGCNCTPIYCDVERNVTQLNFIYSYIQPNRINPDQLDQIIANNTYIWDNEFGILVEYIVEITNLNDSSMNGRIIGKVIETSLWQLETTSSVPGYPIGVTLLVAAGTFYILVKKRAENVSHRHSMEQYTFSSYHKKFERG